MLRLGKATVGVVALALFAGLTGCGDGAASAEAGDVRQLDPPLVRRVLRDLPYRFEFRPVPPPDGAIGAIAGRAYGKHRTYIDFGISLGENASPLPVPQAGTTDVEGFGDFIFTSNVIVRGRNDNFVPGKQLQTQAQWLEANEMVVEMEQRLCRAKTGRPCPV